MRPRTHVAIFAAIFGLVTMAGAAVQPNSLFSDHAVLQRDMPLPVWGTAEPGEAVNVELAGQVAEGRADAAGEWLVKLPALAVGGPYTLTVSGSNTVTATDILIGEVWLASGQSNMAMSLNRCFDAEQHIAASGDERLRLLTVARRAAAEPEADAKVSWALCTPETSPGFSAVAYYFARKLRAELKVPVGMISTNYGGTPAEAWTSYDALYENLALRPITDAFEQALQVWPEKQREYEAVTLPKWREAVAQAKQDGKPVPRQPVEPMGPTHRNRPAGLYNAMIAPLIPFAIRGAIWYQGESNAGRAQQYRTLFPAMIADWRARWRQGDFPFLLVQLAPYMKISDQPMESSWAELREAQLYTQQTVPQTAQAVITDVGEEDDIHPTHKVPVGERLALAALKLAYGHEVEWLGPVYERMTIEPHQIRLHFAHHGGGLVARGGPLMGFTIAGHDRVFRNASARIENNTVVVWNPELPDPAAVRFGWANFPVVNLWNRAGLPASPFRTDDWPRQ